jgi:hypothetical protein
MKRKIIVFLALALSGNLARGAETSFDGIKCDSQIESVLIGRAMKNGKVAAIEKKYQALNLKLLWSDGMEADGDPWTLTSWMICGKEYLSLNRKNVVKDVLISPPNLPRHKFAMGMCKNQGKTIPTAVLFVPAEDKDRPKQFDRIWTVDDGKLKFRETTGKNISCEM